MALEQTQQPHGGVQIEPGMYVLSAVIILIGTAFVYNLDRKTLAKMKADLEERHGKAGE